MKKTVFLLALALMIGTFGYSQILGGPAYQTEKPDRDKPIADIDMGIEHIIDFIYLPVNEEVTSNELRLSKTEFEDIMKPVKPNEFSILPYFKLVYACSYSPLKPQRNGEVSKLVYVRCTRIN